MEPVLSSSVPPQYNSQSIINTAEEALQTIGVSAAQTVYKSALLDWVDDVTMGDTIDKDSVKGEIANLWLAYTSSVRGSLSATVAITFRSNMARASYLLMAFIMQYLWKRSRISKECCLSSLQLHRPVSWMVPLRRL